MDNTTYLLRISFLFLFATILSFPQHLSAQFGVNAGYQVNQVDGWNINIDGLESEISGNGLALGLDYWFRLKNQRIEFLPELNYSTFESATLSNGEHFNVDFFSFYFNTNIYILDLLNDCNCPTFSKQNDFFKKGFFLQVSPGVSLPNFRYSADQSSQTGDLQANIAIGMGLDIGLTDLVTITPIVRARYQPNVAWNATFPPLNDLEDPDVNSPTLTEADANIWQFFAGVRVGIRLDNW